MKRPIAVIFIILVSLTAYSQKLKIKPRKQGSPTGTAFAASISDTTISLTEREKLILNEFKNGNIPSFLRRAARIEYMATINNVAYTITYNVLPDYLAIGDNENYFYCPMTPMLAQQIATLTGCYLPTRKMVNDIYDQAEIKLTPLPIPPSAAMITVPVFLKHNELVIKQLLPDLQTHNNGALTAGNKKDVVISNKIYGEPTPRVVIYGWHKPDGKPIQPLYNRHTNTWADYSHGIRLVHPIVRVNGKKTTVAAVLKDPVLHVLLSDEGVIERAFYP